MIEPNSGQPASGSGQTDGENISPDRRVKRFVGSHGASNLMISAIKQDRIGLPG